MDDNADDAFRRNGQFEQLVGKLGDALFVVNAKGEVLYVLQNIAAEQRQPGIEADNFAQLTERERDVLSLICEGRNDNEPNPNEQPWSALAGASRRRASASRARRGA